jgi:NhaP-type Na+/H+ or K+/H+ antiporter
MSIFSAPSTTSALPEHQIHTFLAYLTLATTVLAIGSTLVLILSQYRRASRSLSTRQGVQRRRLVILFLGLAGACFFVVTTLKYVDAGARAEAVDTLAGGFGEDKDGEVRKRWDAAGDGDGVNVVQVEVPSA